MRRGLLGEGRVPTPESVLGFRPGADYKLATDPLKCLTRKPAPLAEIPTRLEKMPRDVQNRLMNWGYAICDAALRAHIDAELRAKLGIQIGDTDEFPFPGGY